MGRECTTAAPPAQWGRPIEKKRDGRSAPLQATAGRGLFFLPALAVAAALGRRRAAGRLAALAPLAADIGHVCTVAAYRLPAFLPRAARFLGIEFVRRAFLVRCLAAF